MRIWPLIVLASLSFTGCAEEDKKIVVSPLKAPNNELILDSFERHAPQSPIALRFRANGQVTVAKDKGKLDVQPPLGEGSWELDKDQLTLTFDKGGDMCTPDQKGVYKVVISKLGIRFTKVEDECENRAHFDGSTFWRVK